MPWAPDYIDAAALASFLRIDDTVDHAELAGWCTSASRAVDFKTNRQFGQLAAAAARVYRQPAYYRPDTGLWVVEIDDLMDLVGMTINGVAYASSGAVVLPDNAPADGTPWTALAFTSCPTSPLTVVARWGWSAVPAQVPGACKLQCARWNARRDSPFGIAGSPDSGGEMRLLARLDPDVATVLAGLVRRRRAG